MFFIDLDGTILNTGYYHKEMASKFFDWIGVNFKSYGVDVYNAYLNYFEIQEVRNGHLPKEVYDNEISVRREYYENKIEAVQGAEKVLKLLKKNNERVVVLTGTPYYLAKAALDRLDLMKYIETIVCFDGTVSRYTKTDTCGYTWLCEYFGEDRDNMIMIDNDPEYCYWAKKAGWKIIGVLNEYYPEFPPERFEDSCDALRYSMESVYQLLKVHYDSKYKTVVKEELNS